jgi:hypothetical protein
MLKLDRFPSFAYHFAPSYQRFDFFFLTPFLTFFSEQPYQVLFEFQQRQFFYDYREFVSIILHTE